MQFEIVRAVEIDRPIDEVFAFVADTRNDPTWCAKVRSVRQTAGDGAEPGARFVVEHKPFAFQSARELTIAVVELAAPRRVRFAATDSQAEFDVLYELEPLDTRRTRLTMTDRIDSPVPAIVAPLARRFAVATTAKNLEVQFAALKHRLETAPQATRA